MYNIGNAFKQIEDDLIGSMIRNLDHHRAEELKEGFNWSQWQVEQLAALDEYKKRNLKKYKGVFGDINNRIDEIIAMQRQAGKASQEVGILKAIKEGAKLHKAKKKAGIDGRFFKTNDRKLNALVKATKNDFKKAEYAMLRMSNDRYRQVIFNAQVYANMGAGTYEKAVDMATKDFLRAGINCVEYKNGSRHTVEDYTDMAIRTAGKRAYLTGEGEKRKEWGISTVIMNKRGNPCAKCLPFVGKVLIDDVWSGGKQEDGPYQLMSEAIAQGLYHPRCKDSHTTYFPELDNGDDTPTKEEKKEVIDNYNQEQKANYCKTEANKLDRMAKYSLDPDNKRMYQDRANEYIDQYYRILKLSDTIENPKLYDILKLARNINRKEKNIGVFSQLPIPMQKRTVKDIASRYAVDLSGITVKIQRSEKLLALPLTGATDSKNIGRIDLFPNAFTNEETLVRTLIHEKCHVRQLKKYGAKYAQEHLFEMEKEAYAFEEFYYRYLKGLM